MSVSDYIQALNTLYATGKTTEHTFRGDLQRLIQGLMPRDFAVINEPKRQACGAPDYIIEKKGIAVGYIEAKDIGDKDLDGLKKAGNKEQFDRYKASLSNIVFTDYLSFHFYQNGALVTKVAIGEVVHNYIKPLSENFTIFENLIKNFATYIGQTINSPKSLAEMMAAKARLLSDVIENALNSDEVNLSNSTLQDQYEAFKQILIHDITHKGFADVYAQTITYGLFAARLHDHSLDSFTRQEAAELIPKTNPFLRKLFNYIAGPDIDDRIKWIVDNLANIFLHCDVRKVLKNFGRTTAMNDPIIHFYETFLSEYDPSLRKARGVWYTPAPVVDFIVRAVDDILKEDFDLKDGLADSSKTKIKIKSPTTDKRYKDGYIAIEKEVHKVQILDPATGTGTFLAQVIKQVYKGFKGQEGIWNSYAETDLIPRLNGFELLMASYAMAHLQLDLLLSEIGYAPKKAERLRVYLTNSLEESHPDTGTLFASWLSSEANEANHIKRDTPVMCVIGNPPYSGESANKGKWIMDLMEDYKKEPGGKEKLKEKNPKWINDDYVKFIRYGQYFIEKNGSGILAYINPHGFLDNPTFRGMRWNLLKTFDKIYTIDLHGNSKKKEIAPDGSIDQNVFDIMQGVSINIFVKTGRKPAKELAQVFHYDLYGKREAKYEFLNENSLASIPYILIPNKAPNYFMAQKDFEAENTYTKFFKINDLFPLNNVGIVTARDSFTIQTSTEQVQATIDEFLSLDDETARSRFSLGKDVRDWQVGYARKDLQNNYPDKGKLAKILYRPFDERWTFYTGKSKGFHCYPRNEVMQHFATGANIGLIIGRQGQAVGSMPWNLTFITKSMTDFNLYYRGGGNTYPLYLYPDVAQQDSDQHLERLPNLNMEIVHQIERSLDLSFIPEVKQGKVSSKSNSNTSKDDTKSVFTPLDLLDYIYAILHSPRYRETYKEFLKIDFPRLPYPKDGSKFWQLVQLGGKLRQLHLLESPDVEKYITQYPIGGDNLVEKIIYREGKVNINDDQYFANVPDVVWNFYIGGYQPAQKWLKDRKGMVLRLDDIRHYQKMVVSLFKTHEITQQIDRINFL